MAAKPRITKITSTRIAIPLIASGIAALALSIFSSSQILAFIGLGLTFWGALFILVTPQRHVECSFIETSTLPEYMTIDRIINDFKPLGEAYNIPSYPKDIYLPEHLKGLKEMVTFIPAENATEIPSIEELAKGKFSAKNPKGILITPPGSELLNQIEQKRTSDLARTPKDELCGTLAHLLNELNIAKEITMTQNEKQITVTITDSLYKNLYSQEHNLKSVNLIGCPLINAAACAIAKATGNPTTTQKIKTAPDGQTTTAVITILSS